MAGDETIKITDGQHKKDDRRKGPTEDKNAEFDNVLKMRMSVPAADMIEKNMGKLRAMSTGKPLKERLFIPDGVDVFQYGAQKLNVWEFQKEQLRQEMAKDNTKFYTYSKDYLSLAFPLVNENEIVQKAKEDNESRWKTKTGFDNVMKRENWNEHPKRPA